MKAKKWVTFITAGISAISLICAIVANCPCVNLVLMYDISMAIFGSALLGFIMSLIEYFAERRKAMEDFLGAAYKIYVQFRKLKYIEFSEPKDIVLDCIAEEQHNKYVESFGIELAKDLGLTINHQKRDEFIAWIEENEYTCFSENDDIESILIQIYNERIKDYTDRFMKHIDMYIALSKLDLENLSNFYGDLDFLFNNRKMHFLAGKSIYSKFYEYRNKILQEVYHFNMLKEGNGNFKVCCYKVVELNDFFFETNTTVNSDEIKTTVYQTKFYDISDKMQEFRSKIYFKKKKTIKYEDRHPCICRTTYTNGTIKDESAF